MVDRGVEVLEDERDALALPQLGDPPQRAARGVPHRRADLGGWDDGQAPAVETGPVQVEARGAQAARHDHRLGGGAQQLVSAGLVGERARRVAGHRREHDAVGRQRLQRVEVVVAPVPDLDGEPRVADGADAVGDRSVDEEHLRAGGEDERRRSCADLPRRPRPVPACADDSMQARAMASARRASSPVTTGGVPLADGGAELGELAGVGVAEQLDVAARGVPAQRRRRPVRIETWRRSPTVTMPARAEDLGAHVVAVRRREARLGHRDGAVVVADDDDGRVEQARRP